MPGNLLQVKVPDRIFKFVLHGTITVRVDFTRNREMTGVRFIEPCVGLNIDNSVYYTIEAAESLLEKVERQLPLIKTALDVSDKIRRAQGLGPVEPAAIRGRSAELTVVTRQGLKNRLPDNSLTPDDFEKSVPDLFARACAVAEKLGTSKIVSRITSQPEKLHVDGCSDLSEWWDKSLPSQKVMLLSQSKSFKKKEGFVLVKNDWLGKISQVPCPFQDPKTQVDRPEAESVGEEGNSSTEDSEEEGVSLDW